MPGLTPIHLELAREHGHPVGEPGSGYDLVLPLDDQGRIDAAAWRAAPGRSRVRRFINAETEAVGSLAHGPGGQWRFDFLSEEIGDDIGFRLQSEQFRVGEYVSVQMADGGMHVYRVVSLRELTSA